MRGPVEDAATRYAALAETFEALRTTFEGVIHKPVTFFGLYVLTERPERFAMQFC